MKLQLLFAFIIISTYANAFSLVSIDTLPPEFQYIPRKIILTDSTTSYSEVFKTGDKIIYYRKDRNKKYRKKIVEITESGFIANNQNVKLHKLAKVRHKSVRLKVMPRVISVGVLGLGVGLLAVSLLAFFAVLGTVLATFALSHYIALIIAGLVLTGIGVFTMMRAFKKYTTYFDLEKSNSSIRIKKIEDAGN